MALDIKEGNTAFFHRVPFAEGRVRIVGFEVPNGAFCVQASSAYKGNVFYKHRTSGFIDLTNFNSRWSGDTGEEFYVLTSGEAFSVVIK